MLIAYLINAFLEIGFWKEENEGLMQRPPKCMALGSGNILSFELLWDWKALVLHH